MTLTILAETSDGIVPPRTKKNSPMIVRGMNRPILLPSEAYREWEKAATQSLIRAGQLQSIRELVDGKKQTRLVWLGELMTAPVNCRALIYRDKLIGDAVGFYQAIGDFLEHIGVVENDRLIVSWDGSRLLKDAVRPRVEVEITPLGPAPAVQTDLFAGVMG